MTVTDFPVPPPSPFHRGERAMQERAGVRGRLEQVGPKLIRDFMPDQHRELFCKLPMVLCGCIDAQTGQPWASVLSGAPGFITSPDPKTLRIQALPQPFDPLRQHMVPDAPLGLLGIEPHTRRRNRMNGVVERIGEGGFSVRVEQSFGNCPKYIQARAAMPTPAATCSPTIESVRQERRATSLDGGMVQMLARADTYFIASAFFGDDPETSQGRGVDVSHRGGRPGFLRVVDANTLMAPDFLGNFFFNTLGNLSAHPLAGLLVIDFDSGDLLHLAVEAEIIWDGAEVEAFDGAQRLMRYRIRQAIRVPQGMPLRWSAPEPSPVLPPGSWAHT